MTISQKRVRVARQLAYTPGVEGSLPCSMRESG